MEAITKKVFLYNIYKKYKKRYICSFVLMLLSAFAISLLPQIVNNIFDNAIIKNDIQLLICNMLLYIFACIFYNIIDMNNNI